MSTLVSSLPQRTHELIDQQSNDSTLQDMAKALSLVEDIEAGLAESDASLGVDTATLRNRYGVCERNESSSSLTHLQSRFQTAVTIVPEDLLVTTTVPHCCLDIPVDRS